MHGVIFAVVENGAEVHNGKPGQIAASGSVANSSFDGGDPVLRDGPAKDVVDELDALAALDGFHLDAADAKLSMAAGRLFVFAFVVGFASDGFAVMDFGRLPSEVHVIAFVELG